ncbi:TRAP transporter permease [Chloroflexota bacterium]
MSNPPSVEITRYEILPTPLKAIFLAFTVAGIGIVIYYLFGFSVRGYVMLDTAYYYILIACFLSSVFLILPARRADKGITWYDLIAATLAFSIPFYFFLYTWDIRYVGWIPASPFNTTLALILFLLVIEASRRSAGPIYPLVCLIVGLYPVFAGHMPGVLYGYGSSFPTTIALHIFGSEGLLGIPMKVMGDILIAFLIFAGAMIATGAGSFFLNLALGLLGTFRGGPAKVSVVSSGFFGSLSGSAVSNVVATGSITIPTMKQTGYPPEYAGAIEACASTGGMLMPPVMGAIIFIMVIFLGIDYADIMVAAAIPAVLFYFGLLVQVDAYAAKTGLKGLPRQKIPSLRATLKKGWPFLTVIAFLVWGLAYMRWAAMTPFYAAGLMFLFSFYRKETMMTPRKFLSVLVIIGRLITQTMAVLLPIGFIVAGLMVTGTGAAFTSSIVSIGGGNIYLILLLGIMACYVLGMAGLLAPAYIFLAVSLAPAMIQIGGLNTLAVHLFIVYYSMLAVITPPVANVSFISAAMAGAPPMKTAFTSMRLGVVLYFIPIFFVFNPALILQGQFLETMYLFAMCLVGITLIAGGLEGYVLRVGIVSLWTRPLLVIAGFLIAFPEWVTTIIGAALAVVVIANISLARKRAVAKADSQ